MSYSFTDPDFVPQRFAKDEHVMDIFAGCGGLSYGFELVRLQHPCSHTHNERRTQHALCA